MELTKNLVWVTGSSFEVGASLNILCCATAKETFLSTWYDYMTGKFWSDQDKVSQWFQSWWRYSYSHLTVGAVLDCISKRFRSTCSLNPLITALGWQVISGNHPPDASKQAKALRSFRFALPFTVASFFPFHTFQFGAIEFAHIEIVCSHWIHF